MKLTWLLKEHDVRLYRHGAVPMLSFTLWCRYVDRDGELRPARPPVGRVSSFLPAAAQAVVEQAHKQGEPAAFS